MHPILFKVGPVTIYTYGFFVLIGVAAGYYLALKEADRQGLHKEHFSGLLFWMIVGGFLGARFLYIMLQWRLLFEFPAQVIFGRSGFVFYGGIIGGALAYLFSSSKYRLPFLKTFDIIVLYLPLAHAFGRIGCFFYGCCYGVASEQFGIHFHPDSPAGFTVESVVPTQVISVFFLIVIFIFLLRLNRRKRYNGQIIVRYLVLYGAFRFCIEFLRGDPRGFLWIFSTSQWLSLAAMPAAFFLRRKVLSMKH